SAPAPPPGPPRLGVCAPPVGVSGGAPACCGGRTGIGSGSGGLPVWTAVVRNTLSPQITGVEKPRPGISVFHLMFFVSLQVVGASPRAIPFRYGPRHSGQCAG